MSRGTLAHVQQLNWANLSKQPTANADALRFVSLPVQNAEQRAKYWSGPAFYAWRTGWPLRLLAPPSPRSTAVTTWPLT
jgi:hypothetical protein